MNLQWIWMTGVDARTTRLEFGEVLSQPSRLYFFQLDNPESDVDLKLQKLEDPWSNSPPALTWRWRLLHHTCHRALVRSNNPPRSTGILEASRTNSVKTNTSKYFFERYILRSARKSSCPYLDYVFLTKCLNKFIWSQNRSYRVCPHYRADVSTQRVYRHQLAAPLVFKRRSYTDLDQIYRRSQYPSVYSAASEPPALLHGNAGRRSVIPSLFLELTAVRIVQRKTVCLDYSMTVFAESINLRQLVTQAVSGLDKCCTYDVVGQRLMNAQIRS